MKRRRMEMYPNVTDSSHVLCHLVFQISDDSRLRRLTRRNVHVRHSASFPGAVWWDFCCLYLPHNRCSSGVCLPYRDLSVVPAIPNNGFGRTGIIRAVVVIAPTISKFRICMFAQHK